MGDNRNTISRQLFIMLLAALLIMLAGIFIGQSVFAESNYIQWDREDTTVPTEKIVEDASIKVTVTPDGEMHSFVFTPQTTGPYLFYCDDDSEALSDANPKGRVRAVDPATGSLEYIYQPENRTGINSDQFTVRFEAVKGRTYYLDTIINMTQPTNTSYEIEVEPDEYASISYTPIRRLEILSESDGTVGYGVYLHDTDYWAAQGEFELTKVDGSKEIYKYYYDMNDQSGKFLCGKKQLEINDNWVYCDDNAYDNPWRIGEHKFTVYVEGKPFTVPVWVVSDYTYEHDDYENIEEYDPEDDTEVGAKHTVSGSSYTILSGDKAAFTKAKNAKSVTVPATVTLSGRKFKVTQINASAFKGKKIKNVTIGKNVKTIKKNAFKGSKATTLTVKTTKLTKKTIKGCLKGSKIKTVKVKVGSKSKNKTYVKKYKKIFTKKIAGKKAAVK